MKCQHCNSEEIKEVKGQLVCQFCGNEVVTQGEESLHDKLVNLGFISYEEPYDPYTLGKSFKVSEGYVVIYFPLEYDINEVVISLTEEDTIYGPKKIMKIDDLNKFVEVKNYWDNNLNELVHKFGIKVYQDLEVEGDDINE